MKIFNNYRKKPVVIQAEQFHGWYGTPFEDGVLGNAGLRPFIGENQTNCTCGASMTHHMLCPTLEGDHLACPKDWIIRGAKGEYYPCKPDIFELTYEKADDDG